MGVPLLKKRKIEFLFVNEVLKNCHLIKLAFDANIEQLSNSIYLDLIFAFLQFEISTLMNWTFFPSLSWIFLPAVACKIQV